MAENYYNNEAEWGNHQFVSLNTIIDQFMISYVGENKIIPKTKISEVSFHAHRAIQELSFDTFKSVKSQELTVPNTLYIPLPKDYVNYAKISWSDSNGMKHVLYPATKTSNPKRINESSAKYFDSEYQYETYYIQARASYTSGSDQLVLDGEYKNIVVGMDIDTISVAATSNNGGIGSDGLIDSSTVKAVDTTGGVTTVTMTNTATYTLAGGLLDVKFRNSDGSVITPESNFVFIEVNSIHENLITLFNPATSAVDSNVANLKPGYLISNEHFPPGTVIDAISWDGAGTSGFITVSNQSLTSTVVTNAPSGLPITFYNNDITESTTWSNFKSKSSTENLHTDEDDIYWSNNGERYGLEPQHSQANGSFFIDANKIYFSSNISGKTVILDYISDGIGSNDEVKVHKFAEEAMYKWIAHAILSTTINIPEYMVARFKKERFAAVRTAKLRLSNLKIEELTQIMRGKSKIIKH